MLTPLFNYEATDAVRDYIGDLALFEHDDRRAYGILGKDTAGRLVVVVLDGKATKVIGAPSRFVPLPDARIELTLPTAVDGAVLDPKIGMLMLSGRFLTLLASRTDSPDVGMAIETADVSEGWPMGESFHWRLIHPSAGDDVVTLYDSRTA